MNKRKNSLLLVLGFCLVTISFVLVMTCQLCLYIGIKQCHQVVSKMDEILPESVTAVQGMYPDDGMPVLEIDSVDYVAMLEIPSFGLSLPVADSWNSNQLFWSPARFAGSAYDGSLVIGGVDHTGQFGFCDNIQQGAVVTVTDMTGARFTYTVYRVDRAKQAEGQWLMDADWDLTLFCHDIYSMEYIAVRCKLTV